MSESIACVKPSSSVPSARRPASSSAGSKDFSAPDLGALVVREAVRRAGIDPARVDECIMGNVVSAGLGQAPARQAALRGGLANGVGALTINKVCGSGLKAVMLAAQGIATGDIDVAVAGGMESMSNCPYLLHARARRPAHGRRHDRRLDDPRRPVGLVPQHPHGPDRRARRRRRTASRARSRIATPSRATARPRTRRARAGSRTRSCRSRFRRRRATRSSSIATSRSARTRRAESLARLKPAFKKDGTVTAGNAPGVNDGAAALVVMGADVARAAQPHADRAHRRPGDGRPRAEARDDDARRGRARSCSRRPAGRSTTSDLVELNEAFAVQAVAVTRELGLDPARVNVQGGAVALGHPIGASGARILTTLLYALKRRGKKRGIATLCLGGGNGVALAVELV